MTKSVLATAIATIFASAAFAQPTGPSTAVSPYLVTSQQDVEFTSILSVGDSVKARREGNRSYRMVGIPDGLGAYDNRDGTITVLLNHEISTAKVNGVDVPLGIARTHGGAGAFVSKWQVRKRDLKVMSGADLIRKVYLWDGTGYVDTPNAVFLRFCSADLAKPSAFYNEKTGRGFEDGYIFMNGEETGPAGRAFAHVVKGEGNSATFELPKLGRASWENQVASPFAQDKTIVAGLDDGSIGSSKVNFYVGKKLGRGNPVERAGLTNGLSYQVAVAGIGATEDGIAKGDKNAHGFSLVTTGGTGFNRVEDGAWDRLNPNVFYFVTTASFSTNSRLWKVTFTDLRNPEAGGMIQVVLDGAVSGPKMMDNITVDGDGNLLMQEDPGNNPYLAKLWSFNPSSSAIRELGAFDPAQFTVGAPGFITQDEESSGVIEVTSLFRDVEGYDTAAYRYFLLDAQVHKATVDPELVELGQLLMMKVAR